MNATLTLPQNANLANLPPLDITNRHFRANPFPFYARLRAEQPIYRAKLGRQDAWLVTRYEDVMTLLKDERFVKNSASISGAPRKNGHWVPGFVKPLMRNLLDLDDPDHARLRTLVHKAFTPSRVEQLQGRVQAISDQLLDAAQKRGSMDLVSDYALPIPLTVISELLGIPFADQGKFHRWTKNFMAAPSALNMLWALPSLAALMRYFRKLFAQRREDPRDDLITALVQAEEAGDRLSEDELLAMVTILIVAGHETTVNLIASGALALLQHPDQLALLRGNPSLIRSAVEELLRYSAPVAEATERYAREDVTWHGITIPSGAMTLAVLASANRDEQVFEHPDQLDIRREKNRHVAFGYGVHACVGMPLARLEGQIAINTLVQRLPNLQLTLPAEQLRWRATPLVRGLESLPVRW